MLRVIVILSVISRASFEMQTFQHQMYISGNSRSNSSPIQTGYVYSKVGKGPELITTFSNSYEKPTEKYTAVKTDQEYDLKNGTFRSNTMECELEESTSNDNTGGVNVAFKQNEGGIKAKTKCLKEAVKKDKDLKSVSHDVPDENSSKKTLATYNADKEFRIDGEDVRTDSKNTYIGWPYSYQFNNVNAIEKSKNYRVLGADTSVIPVHEYPDDYNPSSSPVRRLTNSAYYVGVTTDNPIYGNQPFFSFVLNDYFDKNRDDDPPIFKDFTWGEEFDQGLRYQYSDFGRPSRHLNPQQRQEEVKYFDLQYNTKEGDQERVTRKDFDKNQAYAKHLNNDKKQANQLSEQRTKVHRQSGFQNFLDSFANKFGSEKENKNSKFILKQNQDKGESRKGFRRVYHKDEYQEDNEFYDNTNKKAQAEEKGGSNFNIGGSQAVFQSHAAASVGGEANSSNKREEAKDQRFEKNNIGHERHRLHGDKINHFRNIAKNAALNNNADYVDQYRI